MSESEFKFKTHPADFEIIYSAVKNFTLEMGVTMERTSRSPIYFAAHDFSTAIFDKAGNLVTLTEYSPCHMFAAPFAIKAALKYFGDKIYPGDTILTNDPYTFDAGNHLADWTILVPVFYQKKLKFWAVNRAHQTDTGGGQAGAYNPSAQDILAEGMRIPPIKIAEKGKTRQEVMDMLLANVRFPESQRGDLWSMIGSARIGERRLMGLLDMWGETKVDQFILDLYGYTEFLMRQEIDKIPEGTYYGEAYSDGKPEADKIVTIRCQTTVKGSDIIVDLSQSDPMIDYYINSTIANTYSYVFIALMTSIGRTIQFRSEGCMKPVQIRTKPGTIVHATSPAPVGLCTLFVGAQISCAVWDSLAKAIPQQTPAGWGAFPSFVFSGYDPRRKMKYASPDFLSNASGNGAIWGTDGWHAGNAIASSGGLAYPEVEVCEWLYPALWTKWEYITDSCGAGKWRSGAGVESTFVLHADEMVLTHSGEHFKTLPNPPVAGGLKPPSNCKRIFTRANGHKEDGSGSFYTLHSGETLACYSTGGCGVGSPLERDAKLVLEDVVNEIVSIDKARQIYGVIIDKHSLRVDELKTRELRTMKRKA
jgi:N-methylhydantoinase B